MALIAATARPLPAADLYVDAVNGDDVAGDGSAALPWKTITHAARQAMAGDDIHAAAGTYSVASGEKLPLNLSTGKSLHGGPGATIVLGSGSDLLELSYNDSAVVIEDLIFRTDVPGSMTNGMWLQVGSQAPSTNGVTVRRCRFEGLATGLRFTWGIIETLSATRLPFTQPVEDSSVVDSCWFVDDPVGVSVAWSWHYLGPDPLGFAGTDHRLFVDNVFVRNGIGILVNVRMNSDVGVTGAPFRWQGGIWNSSFEGGGTAISLTAYADQGPKVVVPEIVNNVFADGSDVALDWQGDRWGLTRLATNDFWSFGTGYIRSGTNLFTTIAAVNSFQGLSSDNFEADPAFVDAAAGDLHLLSASPCIDRGVDLGAPDHDVDGEGRPANGNCDTIARTDVGADEAPAPPALRRGDFSALAPIAPVRAMMFPFTAANPLTPVVKSCFASGDVDPSPNILEASGIPLSFYQVDPGVAGNLMAIAEPTLGTVRFLVR